MTYEQRSALPRTNNRRTRRACKTYVRNGGSTPIRKTFWYAGESGRRWRKWLFGV